LEQDEQLDVKQGRLGYWRGHSNLAAEVAADDEDATVVIAHGEAHSIWNAGGPDGGDLVVDVTLRPAGAGEAFLETLAGVCKRGGNVIVSWPFCTHKPNHHHHHHHHHHQTQQYKKGLGYEYETARAVSPLQSLLTYYRCGAVLAGWPRWAWALAVEWLVPLAEGLGYRATYPKVYSTRPLEGGGAGAQDAAGTAEEKEEEDGGSSTGDDAGENASDDDDEDEEDDTDEF
jgi:hypothetical protein